MFPEWTRQVPLFTLRGWPACKETGAPIYPERMACVQGHRASVTETVTATFLKAARSETDTISTRVGTYS
jgi:hypothetical protein